MAKLPISVTLDDQNVVWLKGQAVASKGTVSDTLNRLVTTARTDGQVSPHAIRSVVNTIDIDPNDPDLSQADEYMQTLFAGSIGRPMAVKEGRSRQRTSSRQRRRG